MRKVTNVRRYSRVNPRVLATWAKLRRRYKLHYAAEGTAVITALLHIIDADKSLEDALREMITELETFGTSVKAIKGLTSDMRDYAKQWRKG